MVQLDLNYEPFQGDLIALEKSEVMAVLKTFGKIRQMDWSDIYQDKGLKWERIESALGPDGGRAYSIRITKKFRAVVQRKGNHMLFLSLHPDHDSAY